MIGDSHVEASLQGAGELGLSERVRGCQLVGGRVLFGGSFICVQDGELAFPDPEVQDRLRTETGLDRLEEGRGRVVVSMGLAAAPFTKVFAGQRWNVSPGSRRPGWGFASEQLLDQIVRDMQEGILEFLELGFEFGLIVAAVAGPRQQERNPSVALLGREALEAERRYEAPIRAYLAGKNCPVVEPAEAINERGFLKEEFWGPDPSHANAAFGRLVMRDLFDVLGLDMPVPSQSLSGA